MTRALLRTTCAALLVVALAPAAGAAPAICDITQVETLTPRFGPAPKTLAAGKPFSLAVKVVRAAGTPAELPADDVEVQIGLKGAGWSTYGQVVTDPQGKGVTKLAVPRGVKGAAEIDVEVFRVLVDAPCLTIEEHGRVITSWGKVR